MENKQQPIKKRTVNRLRVTSNEIRNGPKAKLTDAYESNREDRILNDLPTTDYTAMQVVNSAAERLRARARHLERNNDIVRRAIHLTTQNVIGPQGIKLTSMAKATLTGQRTDDIASGLIEAEWKRFGRSKDLRLRYGGWRNLLKLLVRRRMVDGEAFVELLPGYDNDSRFSVRIIDPMMVPVGFNDEKKRIKMGIEYDAGGIPIAYYVADRNGEYTIPKSFSMLTGPSTYRRVEADRLLHYYVPERPNQCRGVTLIASPMERLHMLDQYEEATLTGARIASSKMGFFYDDLADTNAMPYQGGGEETLTDPETGESYTDQLIDIAAGQFEDIGTKRFTPFDPGYPPARYEEYTTSILRSISAGLNISYFKLSNDLSEVNYSTAREAKLDDVDAWRDQQYDLIELVIDPVFDAWLTIALLRPEFARYRTEDFPRLSIRKWQPRGWRWIDPEKEMKAVELELQYNLTSPSIVAEERGYDYEEILRTIERDRRLRERYLTEPEPAPVQAAIKSQVSVPKYIQSAAQRGLDLVADGYGGDGLTDQTKREARSMANGDMSDDKVIRANAWAARHAPDLDADQNSNRNAEGWPGAGAVAHYLWGIDPLNPEPARKWLQRNADRIKQASSNS